MIAALVIVALVAASQAQAMPQSLSLLPQAAMQPFNDPPITKVLWCVVQHKDQFVEIYNDAMQHQQELLSAAVELGKRLVPCITADDRSECANKAWDEFLASELNATVRAIFNKVDAMNKSIDKCCGY